MENYVSFISILFFAKQLFRKSNKFNSNWTSRFIIYYTNEYQIYLSMVKMGTCSLCLIVYISGLFLLSLSV